jgi:hypothetical protein
LTVWIPALYPEPVLPILIDLIVPPAATVTVPPAATKGWYPNPSLDPTETIIPPLGKVPTFTSEVELPVPVNEIVVTPTVASSIIEYSLVIPCPSMLGVWKTSLIRTMALSVTIPETLDPPDSNIKFDSCPVNWPEILSKI